MAQAATSKVTARAGRVPALGADQAPDRVGGGRHGTPSDRNRKVHVDRDTHVAVDDVDRAADAVIQSCRQFAIKNRFGRAAYLWTGARNLRKSRFGARITVDGRRWFDGEAGCVLLGNVGRVVGGIPAFDDAEPDDGLLEVGVVTAGTVIQWLRVLTRMTTGRSDRSPLVDITCGATIDVRLDRALPYELDGGDRKPTRRLRIQVEPGALTVCVPDRQPPP